MIDRILTHEVTNSNVSGVSDIVTESEVSLGTNNIFLIASLITETNSLKLYTDSVAMNVIPSCTSNAIF